MSKLNSQDYANFFCKIKGHIRDRQLQAMRSFRVDLEMIYPFQWFAEWSIFYVEST
jgi:hypothetical protein